MNKMDFKRNTAGGGSATNESGLTYEQFIENKFISELETAGCAIDGNKIIKDGRVYATRYKKHDLYNQLCKDNGIDWKDKISGQKLPDDAIFVHDTNTLYIIEKKYQNGYGSNDEKIECPLFKIRQYKKLLKDLNIKVEYKYVLSDWFMVENNPKYRDVFEYHSEIGVEHFFNELPISVIGL